MREGWTPWRECPLVAPDGYHAPASITRVWMNGLYFVQLADEGGGMERLLVKRNDGAPVRSWADMQRIKNELRGPERVAVEVYPPQSELVDEANIYHLWVFPEGYRLPFTLRGSR